MITIRKSSDRGHFDHGWLDTYHTFSFGGYHDPKNVHFRSLRVINEDVVAPGRGFGAHPHDNMEIITWVLSGELTHADNLGHTRALKPGELQRMSAGTGIEHAEYNASKTEPVHLLQIWIMPAEQGVEPTYDQKEFPLTGRQGRAQLLASPDGADGSMSIHQDARVYAAAPGLGKPVSVELKPGRSAWVQVTRGGVTLNGTALKQGDGAAVTAETKLLIEAKDPAEVLVFDLK
jgi:redox-sensitive bicupin YhaK (pirin superfamily)